MNQSLSSLRREALLFIPKPHGIKNIINVR